MKDLRKKTASGFVFKMLEQLGTRGVNFVISLLLARLLSPDEYGTIALVTVFISICDVFVTYGFGNSLVVKKDADHVDFSTCLYFGIALSILFYNIVYVCAPLLASYYEKDILKPVIRVMALRIPIAAVNSVQHAYVSKKMRFNHIFYATVIGSLVSGILAVVMAFMGFGVWAMVAQYLGTALISTVCLWILAKWRPTLSFSFARLKALYSYGWKILAVGLIDTVYHEIRSLLIAKQYSSEDLAYYNKGNNFPALGMKLVEPTINGVLFPALSHCNDDIREMRSLTRKFTQLTTYMVFPIMIGLAVVGAPLIEVLLTEKWLPCVIYLQIGCVAYMFRPLQFVNNCVIKASGRIDLLLKLDIVKKGFGVILLLLSMDYGVEGIALSLVVTNIVSVFLNILPNRKLINYGYWAQFKDIFGNLLLALAMGAVTYPLSLLKMNMLVILILQILTGVVFYVVASALFKNDSFLYILSFLKKALKDRQTSKEK